MFASARGSFCKVRLDLICFCKPFTPWARCTAMASPSASSRFSEDLLKLKPGHPLSRPVTSGAGAVGSLQNGALSENNRKARFYYSLTPAPGRQTITRRDQKVGSE